MKKSLICLFLVALVGYVLVAQPVMKIATGPTNENLYPLIKAIYAELGYQAEFAILPLERALYLTNSGDFDADLGRLKGIADQFPNLIATNEPIFTSYLQAWVKKGSAITITSLDDLKKYRVGIILGGKYVQNLVDKLGVPVEISPTYQSMAGMLDKGRFDVALKVSVPNGDPELAEVGVLVAPQLAKLETFHIFNKKHADLVFKWDAVLKAMKADGRFQKLMSGN